MSFFFKKQKSAAGCVCHQRQMDRERRGRQHFKWSVVTLQSFLHLFILLGVWTCRHIYLACFSSHQGQDQNDEVGHMGSGSFNPQVICQPQFYDFLFKLIPKLMQLLLYFKWNSLPQLTSVISHFRYFPHQRTANEFYTLTLNSAISLNYLIKSSYLSMVGGWFILLDCLGILKYTEHITKKFSSLSLTSFHSLNFLHLHL